MNRIFNKKDILTIPNLLSLVRLLMIPVIVWLYVKEKNYYAATAMVFASGITDIADGIIARKCNIVSDFGVGITAGNTFSDIALADYTGILHNSVSFF